MDDIKKIIWPNDLSDFSAKAAPAVDRLAARTGAEIHLIHVAPDLSGYGRFWGEPDPEHVEGMHDFARRIIRESPVPVLTIGIDSEG